MDAFSRRGSELYAEDVSLSSIANAVGTPTYVYSAAHLRAQWTALRAALASVPHLVCYAVKANGNLALLDELARLGSGFDAVSGGELARLRHLGVDPQRIILSGVGKTDDEIAEALQADVRYLSVESEEELRAVDALARRHGKRARVSLRVNPDIDAATHPNISTGKKQNKFGVPVERARALAAEARAASGLELVGVTCHIGSQIMSLAPFVQAAAFIASLVRELDATGPALTHVGIGGGLGIRYEADEPPSIAEYVAAIAPSLAPLGKTLVLEPGRVLVGNAAVLLARVTRQKRGADRSFVVLDAGMNDLVRPALYQARHGIEPVSGHAGERPVAVDVVGPVCESSDVFASGMVLPPLVTGELVVLRGAGAYGACMGSQYNGRRRPAEVLVDGDAVHVIRDRDRIEDLWHGEHLARRG